MAREHPPRFVSPTLARPGLPGHADGWVYEVKFDGIRAQLRLEHGELCLRSRPGRDCTDAFPVLAPLYGELRTRRLLLGGELVCVNDTGDPDFARLRARLRCTCSVHTATPTSPTPPHLCCGGRGARALATACGGSSTSPARRCATGRSGAAGINVKGIAASADGHDLVIAKRNDNALFHVDVVRVQTGAAVYRNKLLVVSSQFDTLGSLAAVSGTAPPKLPFWVSEVAAGTR